MHRPTLLSVLLLPATLVVAQSPTTTFPLVVPSDAAAREGAASTAIPFGSTLSRRVLYAYDGSAVGFATPLRIGAIELRPDGATPGSSAAGSYDFSLSCSTGVLRPSTLSTNFAANHGDDEIRVHNGRLVVPAPSVGQAPNEFSLRIPFATPFEWDPRNGPLILDIVYGSSTPAFGAWDAVADPGTVGGIAANGSSATTATTALSAAPVLRLVGVGVVVPSAFAAAEGPTSSTIPWDRPTGSGTRTLNLYEAPVVPAGRQLITALAWRTDLGAAFAGRSYDVRISLSTSQRTGATLSTTFADNHGTDVTVVFDGTLVAPPSSASADLSHFDLFCELQRPFEYDAARGALAVDIQLRSSTGARSASFDITNQANLQVGRVSHSSDPNATSGSSAPQPGVALVMSIRSVPVPILPSSLASAVNSQTNATVFPWGSTPCRTLGMLSAAEAGITRPTFVRHLRFRPSATTAFGPSTYTCTIDLSNPSNTPATIAARFDQNHGSNRLRAFDGQFSVPFRTRAAADLGFGIEVKLQRPFLWDPVVHPYLTVDIAVSSRVGPGIAVETTNNLIVDDARVFAAGAAVSTGTAQQLAFVMQIGGETANGLAANYGTGCAGTNGIPLCTTAGVPSLPNRDFRVRLRQASGNSVALLVIGLGSANTPLPGAPGCLLLHGLEFGTFGSAVTDPTGDASVPLPLPSQPGLDGVVLLTQWIVLDPTINALGIATSDGQALTLRFF